MPNRTQTLLIAFLVLAWASLVAILVVAPDVFQTQMGLAGEAERAAELLLLAGVSAIVAVGVVGVLERWRWVFWLLLVASLAGVLRIPAAALQLSGVVTAPGPTWYVVFQATIGALQCAIGLLMLWGYRRHGIWGRF